MLQTVCLAEHYQSNSLDEKTCCADWEEQAEKPSSDMPSAKAAPRAAAKTGKKLAPRPKNNTKKEAIAEGRLFRTTSDFWSSALPPRLRGQQKLFSYQALAMGYVQGCSGRIGDNSGAVTHTAQCILPLPEQEPDIFAPGGEGGGYIEDNNSDTTKQHVTNLPVQRGRHHQRHANA